MKKTAAGKRLLRSGFFIDIFRLSGYAFLKNKRQRHVMKKEYGLAMTAVIMWATLSPVTKMVLAASILLCTTKAVQHLMM